MKISGIYSVNTSQRKNNTKSNTSFKMAIDPILLKQRFEKIIPQWRRYNPQLTDKDVLTMRKSIDSFIAFSKGVKSINVSNVENQIYHKYNIPAHFQGDKYLAGIAALALNVFQKLRLNLPTALYKRPLAYGVRASCSTLDRSVSFNSSIDWSNTQLEAINEKLGNGVSTGHFLRTPIHEFMHSVHIINLKKLAAQKQQFVDNLYSKHLREFLKMDFKTQILSEGANDIQNAEAAKYIKKNVSWYASTKPVEMFAEIGTKMIADTIDTKSILPSKNPFVFKDFTEDKLLMSMMNDFWKGNFDKYIRAAQ